MDVHILTCSTLTHPHVNPPPHVADNRKLFQYWVAPSSTRRWRWCARFLLCLQWIAGRGSLPDWCRCNAAVQSCLLPYFFMLRILTACWHWRVFLSVARPFFSTSVLKWTPILSVLCNIGISYLEHRDSEIFRKISYISWILWTIPGILPVFTTGSFQFWSSSVILSIGRYCNTLLELIHVLYREPVCTCSGANLQSIVIIYALCAYKICHVRVCLETVCTGSTHHTCMSYRVLEWR
jgi:hypothetical protein